MSQLNPEDVPKFNTLGAACRTRKLYYQFPPHDFDKDETKNLNEDANVSFEQLCRSRVIEASGIGKNPKFVFYLIIRYIFSILTFHHHL